MYGKYPIWRHGFLRRAGYQRAHNTSCNEVIYSYKNKYVPYIVDIIPNAWVRFGLRLVCWGVNNQLRNQIRAP